MDKERITDEFLEMEILLDELRHGRCCHESFQELLALYEQRRKSGEAALPAEPVCRK